MLLGELAHGEGVDDGDWQAVLRQLRESALLVTASRFHGNQLHLMSVAEPGKCGDPLGAVREAGSGAVLSNTRGQR